jgi:HSP20 family molecular chaperone IbpA
MATAGIPIHRGEDASLYEEVFGNRKGGGEPSGSPFSKKELQEEKQRDDEKEISAKLASVNIEGDRGEMTNVPTEPPTTTAEATPTKADTTATATTGLRPPQLQQQQPSLLERNRLLWQRSMAHLSQLLQQSFERANSELIGYVDPLGADPYSFFSWPTSSEGFWNGSSGLGPGLGGGSNWMRPSGVLGGRTGLGARDLVGGLAGTAGPMWGSGGDLFNRQFLDLGLAAPDLLPSTSLFSGEYPGTTTATPLEGDLDADSAMTPPSLQDIAKVFPRHVASRVMVNENGNVIWRPAADIFETDDSIIVHVDLPGVPKEEIHVNVRGSDLIIWGEHKASYEAASSRVRERQIGKFRKIVTMPLDDIDTDNIDAKVENGLLEVKIPKKPEVKGRRISIE